MTTKLLCGDGSEDTSIGTKEVIAISIMKKLQDTAPHSRHQSRCCIHRIPDKFHKMMEPSAYSPEVISIGPFHHGKESLKETEHLKLFYMHTLLNRIAVAKFGKAEDDGGGGIGGEEEGGGGGGEIVELTTARRTIKLDSSGKLITTRGWLTILKECVASVKDNETEIRECYSEPIELASEEFVEMMVIDGLFIIEYLTRNSRSRYYFRQDDDPASKKLWLQSSVKWDLLLLENQLPMVVLERLFNLIEVESEYFGKPLKILILGFFRQHLRPLLQTEKTLLETHPEQCSEAKHLLDLLTILLYSPPAYTSKYPSEKQKDPVENSSKKEKDPVESNSSSSSPSSSLKATCTKLMDVAVCTIGVILWLLETLIFLVVTKLTSLVSQLYHKFKKQSSASPSPIAHSHGDFIPTVTELSRAGVRFKMGSGSASFLHMKFSDDGVFEIPPICITDGIHRLFRNIIACEHLFNGRTYMGSYASLMDFLINSAEDVELLRKPGIITNYLGCDKDVSNMFNRLCFEVCSERSYYFDLNENVNKYYKKRRHFWKATLKGEYFHNPWSIISFLAAVLLIILTFTSTVFATLSYFIHKS